MDQYLTHGGAKLNMENEIDLIENVVQKSDSDSFLELKSKYEKCFYNIYHKYKGRLYESGVYPEDALNDVDFVLFKAINDFDDDKGAKFLTFFTNRSLFHFKGLVSNKRSCQTKRTVLLEQEIYENIKDREIFSPVEYARMSDCREIISEVIDRNIFSEKQKRVLRMKFLSSDEIIPTHDVAKKFGMKYCTVSNIIRGSVKKIKKILIEEKKLSISF